MRLFLLIIFLNFPVFIFAQNISGDGDLTSKEDISYQPDPFTNYMLKADNPCNDSEYLELKKKTGDEMSDSEYTSFRKKAAGCQGYLKSIENSKPDKPYAAQRDGKENPMKPYYIIGASATVISIGLIIIL